MMHALCRGVADRNSPLPMWLAMAYDVLMPGRQRPRLKQVPIRCDQCAKPAVRLYPRREAVRSRMSPFRFCSTRCARQHWEGRRRQLRANEARAHPCDQCGVAVPPSLGPGRPRRYCSDLCKGAAKRDRERRQPGGAVLRARDTLSKSQEMAAEAERVASVHRVELTRWLSKLRELQARPGGFKLSPQGVHIQEEMEQKMAYLDAAAANTGQQAAAAAEDLRRSEERLARRAASARERRARLWWRT